MAVLDLTHNTLETEPFLAHNSVAAESRIVQFPLNNELVLGDYDGNAVFALGKTAINTTNHWLGLIRLGGFHLIVTDIKRIGGSYTEAISKQLAMADELTKYNPAFKASLNEDIEQTRQIMPLGYLLPDTPVVDYIWLACEDISTYRRSTTHPDKKHEHVDAAVRKHTLQVAKAVISIF